MKTKLYYFTRVLALLVVVSLAPALLSTAHSADLPPSFDPDEALPSALTYQGYLSQNGFPVSGYCDLVFSLWSVASGISPRIGQPITKINVPVTNGVFAQLLDFGEAPFQTGEARWLGVDVRCPSGSGSYATLTPRQLLTATPFSTYSRGVWDFGTTGSMRAATPLGSGPGWLFFAPNGHRRDIVGSVGGISIGASTDGSAASQNQFAIAENGNVGIGTSSPNSKLDVDFGATGSVRAGTPMGAGVGWIFFAPNGHRRDVAVSNGDLYIGASMTNGGPPGNQLSVNENGNIGIGTDTPIGAKLQIVGGSGDGINIVKADDDGIQIGDGQNFPKYGLFTPDPGTPNTNIIANTAAANGEWGILTSDKIRAANVTMNSVTLIAVVDGAELNPGDVVAATGFAASGNNDSTPLATVTLATGDSVGIVGVVESRMVLIPESGKADGKTPMMVLHSVLGPAKTGDYVAITIAGVAQVKVDASMAPITAGQRLTSAQTPGQARSLRTANLDGMVVTEGAPVIGVALESLDTGQGLIWTLVSLQ